MQLVNLLSGVEFDSVARPIYRHAPVRVERVIMFEAEDFLSPMRKFVRNIPKNVDLVYNFYAADAADWYYARDNPDALYGWVHKSKKTYGHFRAREWTWANGINYILGAEANTAVEGGHYDFWNYLSKHLTLILDLDS